MASCFIIIYCVAYIYVEQALSRDIRRPGEVCNSRNVMLNIIRGVRMGMRDDGNMSEHDTNVFIGGRHLH